MGAYEIGHEHPVDKSHDPPVAGCIIVKIDDRVNYLDFATPPIFAVINPPHPGDPLPAG
jgi:hypothetical protein